MTGYSHGGPNATRLPWYRPGPIDRGPVTPGPGPGPTPPPVTGAYAVESVAGGRYIIESGAGVYLQE